MARLHLPLAALVALGALLACRAPGAATNAASTPTTRLTPTPQAASLSAARDQVVSVVLAGQATAGYEWSLQEGFDTRVVRQKGAKRVGELAPGSLVGVSAAEIFDFQAVAVGQATLVFVNKRPWEAASPSDETRRITVTVR